jgi:hypothetical protein
MIAKIVAPPAASSELRSASGKSLLPLNRFE